jgi:hypothetical protein
MTTLYVQGTVNAPTGPDSSSGVYGYDNGGFFGPAYANLGGVPFTVTWTGTDCNCYGGPGVPSSLGGPISPIPDAVLTINGISVDINAFNNIWEGEWLDHTPYYPFIQIQTTGQSEPFPPWSPILPSSQYSLTTNQLYADGEGGGVFYLQDSNHSFETNAYLTVSHMGPALVPGPVIGTGLPALALFAVILIHRLFASRRLSSRQPASAAAA